MTRPLDAIHLARMDEQMAQFRMRPIKKVCLPCGVIGCPQLIAHYNKTGLCMEHAKNIYHQRARDKAKRLDSGKGGTGK